MRASRSDDEANQLLRLLESFLLFNPAIFLNLASPRAIVFLERIPLRFISP
jgi:hypothetical protein